MKISCQPRDIYIAEKGQRIATASITLDDAFVVRGLSLFKGQNGLNVGMPQVKNSKGEYSDRAFPITAALRSEISDAVVSAYNEKLNEMAKSAQGNSSPAPAEEADYQMDMV